MKLSRPRFTVRRLMIAVAVVAVELACWSFLQGETILFSTGVAWWIGMGINMIYLNIIISIILFVFISLHNLGRLD
jgi:hypothetical protein